MIYCKASESIDNNSSVQSKNLIHFEKAAKQHKEIQIDEENLSQHSKTPKEIKVLGRYLFLATEMKSKNKRCKVIAKELQVL